MLKRFFSYYKPYMGLFILDFSCAVLAALLELSFPLAISKVMDDLLPNGDWDAIWFWGILLLVLYVISSTMHYVVTYFGHKLGINIETDMRNQLFSHVQRMSFRFFDKKKTGKLVSRMTNDLMDIGEIAHHGPEDLFIAIMTLTGAFGLMLSINWQLAVLTFIVVPFLIGLSVYFTKKMSAAFDKMFSSIGQFHSRVENNISGIRVVKAFGNESHEMDRFIEHNEQFRKTKLTTYQMMAVHTAVSHFLIKSVTVFGLVCGAWFVLQKNMTYGEFVSFVLLTGIFLGPIQQINAVIEMYPKGAAGFKRFASLIDQSPDEKDADDAIEVDQLNGDIVFEHVSFQYESDKPVLHDINLEVKQGETIAVVGPSGAGKSTLCSLLPRFYEWQEGTITIDGIETRKMTLPSLRRQIGVVQQDIYLFHGTIRENILYGKLDASDEEVWQAVEKAQLKDLVNSLPNGLDTIIGERGMMLSGGQKQRISIARIFLKNPPIFILDEATSSLDTETESFIQGSLEELSEGRTTFIIAHRLATIQHADRIVVLTKEGIKEQGRHEDLLEMDGMYRRLYETQFRM
ncbi:ABC transporter ATP-binding protein [Bacillus altitudinis]|uniref:ABC transporter ATP-binding protein n=2 Tax=Bacillus altitudinis TaxID=293387 RepID=A0A653N1E4_BACAB|nr:MULTISPECIES: ABC transporter ATP-binding protein [Bacillus]EMI14923.1 putative abc transporter atp-binding protein [Bacillus stratosphericus LAMA 585]KWZ64945.1 multidrug ABC transporter ATP-binding protein [Bacillus altitudinis]MBR0579761.1 ABC transporter ATP-binding protein [Bacillus altitudinis A23-8]MCW4356941.1 ABC transporter ATP-binding protein/permease [Bacillus altitudinis]MCY7671914.1 ABC transporter ATP-binding protein/permease [Bacillus altitudinis]